MTSDNFEQRARLAQQVFECVFENTASFHDDEVGADLAYLMGAILKNSLFDATTGDHHELLHALRNDFPPEHAVWTFIKEKE